MKLIKKVLILLICASISTSFSQEKTILINDTKQNLENNPRITAVLSNNTGETIRIFVKRGNYRVNTPIKVRRSNVIIEFENGANIYFTSNNAGIIVSGNNCQIKNGNFIGNGQSAKDIYNGFGILLAGADNAIISGNSFTNISGIPIFIARSASGKGSSNNIITYNTIKNNALIPRKDGDEAGILMGYSGNGYFHSNNKITYNTIEGNRKLNIGIGLIGHGKDNLISNNTIRNCLSYGIIAYESDYTEKSLYRTTVESNIIENIGRVDGVKTKKGMGIYLMKSQNSRVANNQIRNTLLGNDKSETLGSGAITLNGALNCIVTGNIIDKSNMYGITNAYSFNSKISGNKISDINKSAIYLINVADVEISLNEIRNVQELVFKGFFENTSLNYIKKTWKFSKYQNVNTGNNINILNNAITNSKRIISFTSTAANSNYKGQKYKGNVLGNNRFSNNTINAAKYNLENNEKKRAGIIN